MGRCREVTLDLIRERSEPEPNSGCWLWAGAETHEHGYGSIAVGGRARGAHRASYELVHGPVAPGLVLDHLCRTPACVNPDHLEAVTPRVNSLRGIGPTAVNAAKNTCRNGHPLSGVSKRQRFERYCAICRRERDRANYAKKPRVHVPRVRTRLDDTPPQRVARERTTNALKTHCPFGHELSGENLRVRPGQRECKICRRRNHRARRARRRAG